MMFFQNVKLCKPLQWSCFTLSGYQLHTCCWRSSWAYAFGGFPLWRFRTRFTVLAMMNINMTVLWVVTPCCLVDRYQRFGVTDCLILISEQLFISHWCDLPSVRLNRSSPFMTPCCLVDRYQRFGVTDCFILISKQLFISHWCDLPSVRLNRPSPSNDCIASDIPNGCLLIIMWNMVQT